MLTATLLSVFLWVAVSADRVAERPYSADLLILNSDRRWVETGRQPDTEEVTVDFTGPSGELALLAAARPQILVSIDSVESSVVEIRLTPDMVRGRGGRDLEDVRAIRVRPDRIVLHFQPSGQKIVPVVPDTERLGLADGHVLSDSIGVEPAMVSVEGPAATVAEIDSVYTTPVPGSGLRERITVEVPLVPPDPSGLVVLSSTSVQVTVAVEPRAERIFAGIPVIARAADGSRLRVEPSLVDVYIAGPRRAVEGVRAESLTPQLRPSGADDYGRTLPITMPAPTPFVDVRVEPDSARIVPEGG